MRHSSRLSLTRESDSWGPPGEASHQRASTLGVEDHGGLITLSIHQGAYDAHAENARKPESVASISLPREAVATLAAFLASLPAEA